LADKLLGRSNGNSRHSNAIQKRNATTSKKEPERMTLALHWGDKCSHDCQYLSSWEQKYEVPQVPSRDTHTKTKNNETKCDILNTWEGLTTVTTTAYYHFMQSWYRKMFWILEESTGIPRYSVLHLALFRYSALA
jgi:hypothetical protein